MFGGPGDSARIVIAPSNVAECYALTVESFQLAEKYQTPVIVLSDFYLDNRVENLVMPTASEETKADGSVYPDEIAQGAYHRYVDTDSECPPGPCPEWKGSPTLRPVWNIPRQASLIILRKFI